MQEDIIAVEDSVPGHVILPDRLRGQLAQPLRGVFRGVEEPPQAAAAAGRCGNGQHPHLRILHFPKVLQGIGKDIRVAVTITKLVRPPWLLSSGKQITSA